MVDSIINLPNQPKGQKMTLTNKDKINEISMNLKFFRNMLVAWDWENIEFTDNDEFGMTYFLDNLTRDLDEISC